MKKIKQAAWSLLKQDVELAGLLG